MYIVAIYGCVSGIRMNWCTCSSSILQAGNQDDTRRRRALKKAAHKMSEYHGGSLVCIFRKGIQATVR
jgi:hypothetical protein